MYDIVTFGETMLRFSPPNNERFEQMSSCYVYAGGSEMSIAVAGSRLGLKTAWISRLPNNPLGWFVRNQARLHGVDTKYIAWAPEDERVGIYFMEYGASPRPSNVIYDRKHSAISKISLTDIDWKPVFQNSTVFMVSGITPALSEDAAAMTRTAVIEAKKAGCTVAVDLNYRAKLWTQEKACDVMTPLMEYTDILITTEEDTKRVFGIESESYEKVAELLRKRFSFKAVAITIRETVSIEKNNWSAFVLADTVYRGTTYTVQVVDRIGAGDSFTAGLLFGYINNDWQQGIDYGLALSALKHTHPGDSNFNTRSDIERLLATGGGGRIQR